MTDAEMAQRRGELLVRFREPPMTEADHIREVEECARYDEQCRRDAAAAAAGDARRMRRAQFIGASWRWAPFRFARWVRSVVHSIRVTRWRLLVRLAGERPRLWP